MHFRCCFTSFLDLLLISPFICCDSLPLRSFAFRRMLLFLSCALDSSGAAHGVIHVMYSDSPRALACLRHTSCTWHSELRRQASARGESLYITWITPCAAPLE